MTFLVDSDWVADYLKGRPSAIALLDQLLAAGIAVSVITIGEIHEGIYYGRDPERHAASFLRFLRWVDVPNINEDVARRFGIIRGALRAKGQLIGDSDMLSAATALHHNLTLVTRNVRDFQRIPDLRIYHSS